ncbi:histone H1-like repetitive region-containing protein [Actinopolymorpha sp. B11F2]|uniref:TraR/DksA family transcriptional regulator n=1 Tax=Actinopolymorpha sp. B11F2 TaxID=3160862 RepID=UPI0032E4DE54
MVTHDGQLGRPYAARSDTPGRNSVTRKATAGRAPAKKTPAKKAPAKKAPAKKAPVKKAAAKKAPAKDTVPTKASAKKAPAKKAPTKETVPTKASAKKAPAKKAPAKKTVPTKASAKKAPAREATAKKAPARAPAKKATRPRTAETGADLAERAPTLKVRADEEPWSEAELEELYLQLRAEADRLRTELDSAAVELADLLRDSGDGAGDDQADAGSKTFEREHEMSLAANTRDMLAQTERAMGRIRNGTYGICEGCGNPIGKARLLAFPRATLCVSCKQREERR